MPSGDEIRDVQRATWAGTGEPGLTVARLAPRGHVVLTDLAAEMLDIATRRAGAQRITNIETMAKATAEFARVLKPGGRLCSSVWINPEENPWTTIAMQAIASEAMLGPPDPDGPNMFRCAAPGYVSALYAAAGLRDVAEWNVEVELVTRSPAQYWEMISEHVSLAFAALGQVDEPTRERIAKAVIAKVSTYQADGTLRIPGVARCIVGAKQ